jgi:Conserved mid region of cactin
MTINRSRQGSRAEWDWPQHRLQSRTQLEGKLKKTKLDKNEHQAAVRRRNGIHQNVAKDVTEIFKGKTTKQLDDQTDGVDFGIFFNCKQM